MKKLFKTEKSEKEKKRKKPVAILALTATLAVFGAVGGAEYLKSIYDAHNQVVVSFDTNGGEDIPSVVIDKGTSMGNIPCADRNDSFFTGWCYDKQLTQPFFADDTLEKNTVLYASYEASEDEADVKESTELYQDDCDPKFKITLHSENEITSENLSDYLNVDSYLGEIPNGFTVSSLGNGDYEVVPNQNYTAGCTYDFTSLNGTSIVSEDGNMLTELSCRIHKDESEVVELKKDIVYLDWDDVIKDGSSYNLYIPKSDEYTLTDDTPLCMLNGYNEWVSEGSNEETYGTLFDDDCLFITAKSVSVDFKERTIDSQTINDDNWYYVEAEDGDLEDVISDVDVFEEFEVSAKEVIDIKEIEQNIAESEGIEQMADLLSCAIMDDDEFIRMANDDKYDNLSIFDPISVSADDNDNLLFREGLAMTNKKNVKLPVRDSIKVDVSWDNGQAANPNFPNIDRSDPDNKKWSAMRVVVEFEKEIKDVSIWAQIDITEYMKVTMQGYKDWDGSKLEFDYAANMYTQTNFDFTVQIKTDGEGEWEDISDSVTSNIKNADLVSKYQKMINADGGYIELVDTEIIGANYYVIPAFPLFNVHLGLNYVLKFDLAAGINSNFTYLDATQVGMRGKTGDGLESYSHELLGANRYAYDLTACGYLGVKTGLKGTLSLSFTGLEKFGKVGISIELGAYFDMYGYLDLSISKPYQYSSKIDKSFSGGYYMEMGIYLEVKVFAAAEAFGADKDWPIVDEKWKLFSLGNQYVPLQMTKADNTEYFMHKNSSNIFDICGISTSCMDMKTGKIVDKKLQGSGNFYVRTSDDAFNVDYDKMTLSIDGSSSNKKAKVLTIEVYSDIPTLSNLGNSYTDLYFCGSTKLYWADPSIDINSIEDFEKTYKATYCLKFPDGTVQELYSKEVMASETVGGFYYNNSNDYIFNLSDTLYTDDNPNVATFSNNYQVELENVYITEDTVFYRDAEKYPFYVYFLYYDDTTDQWKGDIRLCGAGDTPVPPEEATKTPGMTGWSGHDNVIGEDFTGLKSLSLDGIKYQNRKYYTLSEGETTLPESVMVYSDKDKATTRLDTEAFFDEILEDGTKRYYNRELVFTQTYIATYNDCNVTLNYKDVVDGEVQLLSSSVTVPFDKKPTSPSLKFMNEVGKLIGWDTDGDGLSDTETNEYGDVVLPSVRTDGAVFTAIYEQPETSITLMTYNLDKGEYEEYGKLNIENNQTLTFNGEEVRLDGNPVAGEDTDDIFAKMISEFSDELTFENWEFAYNYPYAWFEKDSLYIQHYCNYYIRPKVAVKPIYTFLPADGTTFQVKSDGEITEQSQFIKELTPTETTYGILWCDYFEYDPYTESVNERVEFAGWDINDDGIVDYQAFSAINIPKSTTFKAILETIPSCIEVNISSSIELDFPDEIKSCIKCVETNGTYEYSFNGVYSQYQILISYIDALPEKQYVDEETGYTYYYHNTNVYSGSKYCVYLINGKQIQYIPFINIGKKIIGHTVTFNAGENGYFINSDQSHSTTFTENLMNGTYNINDFTIYSTKSPHHGDTSTGYYYVDYWMDENGDPIENDEFTVSKGSRTLTAHWKYYLSANLNVDFSIGAFAVGNDYTGNVYMNIESDTTYTYDDLVKPEQKALFKNKYELSGWKDSRDNEEIIHSLDEEFTISSGESVTFTAVMERTATKVLFSPLGGSSYIEGTGEKVVAWAGNNLSKNPSFYVPLGEKWKASDLPRLEDLENDSYSKQFIGWEDQNEIVYKYDDDETIITINDSLEFYPVYKITARPIYFSSSGGKFSDGSLSMYCKFEIGKTYSVSEFPMPTRENTAYENYELIGWKAHNNSTNEDNTIALNSTFIMDDNGYTIEAIWKCTEIDHQYKYVYDENSHWKICINESCSTAEAGKKETHDFDENGSCKYCGYGCVTPPLNDGIYEISTAAQLFGFAELVNARNIEQENTNVNAKLMCDITINDKVIDEEGNLVGNNLVSWTPIGTNSYNNYNGEFDGNGKTISGLYYNGTDDYAGLFGIMYEATVHDLIIADSYFAGSPNFTKVGGIAASASSCIIYSVENRATISGYRAAGISDSAYGGQIKNCLNTGKIIAQDRAAGIAVGSSPIINCCSNGKMIVSDNCNAYSIGSGIDGSITNIVNSFCNVDLCVDSVENATCGKTTEQFTNGEVAYLLSQGCTVDNTTYDGSIWGQTIGKDTTPVLNGAKVYKIENYEGCEGNRGKSTNGYSNSESAHVYKSHNYEDGCCTMCGSYQPAEENTDGVYEIDNTGKLYWFAQEVNNGNTGINVILTANIAINKGEKDGDVANCNGVKQEGWMNWTPVGNKMSGFTGTFDGNGYTISGLYFYDTTQDYVGLFGYIDTKAKIKNVGITDSYFNGNENVGGVCGENNGTISNCYYIGTVTGNGNINGICGSNTGSIANCYSNDKTGIIGGTVTNCYYLADKANENGGKTLTQFKNGEVAYLLSQGCTVDNTNYDGSVWGQTIGTDTMPILGGKKVLANVDKSDFANDIIVYGQNVILDGTIGFNIYVSADDNYEWSKTVNNIQGEEIENGLYEFTYQVAAKDMDKDIRFMINDKIDITVSVSEYFDKLSITYNEPLKNLADSTSNYGDAAKAFFNNETVTPQTIEDDLSSYAFTVNMPEGISYYGSSLILESETTIRHYFKLDDGKSIDSFTFTVGENTLTPKEKQGYYYIDIENVSAEKLGESFNVSINGEEAIKNYSAVSYVNKVLKSESTSENLKNLVKVLYLYNKAAIEYID